MKKVIFGISTLVILAFIVITSVNAQTDEKKDKKAKTEVVNDCSKCPSAASCGMATGEAPVPGSQAKQSCANCDPAKCKDGKCDAACKANCTKSGTMAGCKHGGGQPADCSKK